MWVLLLYFIVSIIIPLVLFILFELGILKFYYSKESTVFECGFDSYNVRLIPISLRFYVFCILFLILDLELVIVSCIPLLLFIDIIIINFILFFVLVTVRLIIDWIVGTLSWVE